MPTTTGGVFGEPGLGAYPVLDVASLRELVTMLELTSPDPAHPPDAPATLGVPARPPSAIDPRRLVANRTAAGQELVDLAAVGRPLYLYQPP